MLRVHMKRWLIIKKPAKVQGNRSRKTKGTVCITKVRT